MSAAEKLGALDVKAVGAPWLAEPDASTNPCVFDLAYNDEDCEVIAALRNALPQIVAVVEAAEAVRDELDNWEPTEHARAALINALAALDEALGDKKDESWRSGLWRQRS